MADDSVDALVLAARFDETGLAASGRRVLNRVEEVARASSRAFDAGRANPLSGTSRDILRATREVQSGRLSLEGYVVALQHARTELTALGARGLPVAKQLESVNAAIDHSVTALARQDAVTARVNPGLRRMAGSMATLATSSVGASSAIGSAAQSVLFLSLGMGRALGPIAAVAAAVLAASFAHDKLTESSRAAKEEQDKLLEAGTRRLEGDDTSGPAAEAAAQAKLGNDARLAQIDLNKEIEREKLLFGESIRLQQLRGALAFAHAKQVTAEGKARELNLLAEKEATEESLRRLDAQRDLVTSLGTQLAALQIGEDLVSEIQARAAGGSGAEALQRQINQIKAARQAAADLEKTWATINAQMRELEARGQAVEREAREIGKAYSAEVFKALQDARDAMDDFRRATAASVDSLLTAREIVDEFEAKRIQELADAFGAVADSAFGVADAAHSIGLIGDEAADSLASVGDLANALGQIATGNVLGGILGGISALGGMFGESAAQREQRETLEENNLRLAELRQSLDAANIGAQRFGTARAQLREARAAGLDEDPRIAGAPKGTNERRLDDQADALGDIVRRSGESLEEWANRIERETGIDVLDDKGHIIAGSLEQASKAIDLMTAAATRFSQTASGIESRLSTEEKLGLIPRSDDPLVAALEHDRDVQLEALNLGEAEEARIRALDLKTAEGRAEFLRQQQELFKRIKAGELTAEELGAIENADILGALIGDTADDLGAFDEATRSATDAIKGLTNLPDTFKLASAEFAARAVDTPGTPIAGFTGPTFNPPSGAVVTGNVINLQISVPGANKSVGDIARSVADELEYRRLGTIGMEPAP
jgi:hypothetical protein